MQIRGPTLSHAVPRAQDCHRFRHGLARGDKRRPRLHQHRPYVMF